MPSKTQESDDHKPKASTYVEKKKVKVAELATKDRVCGMVVVDSVVEDMIIQIRSKLVLEDKEARNRARSNKLLIKPKSNI